MKTQFEMKYGHSATDHTHQMARDTIALVCKQRVFESMMVRPGQVDLRGVAKLESKQDVLSRQFWATH